MNRNGEPSKIVEILVLPSQGQSIEDICRQYNISTATFYNWRNRYGGMDTEELRKSKALEAENAGLRNYWLTRAWTARRPGMIFLMTLTNC